MIVWTYVMTYDLGGAPNFEPPVTTLTLCAPRVRREARPGDLVLAFNGSLVHAVYGNERHPEKHSVRWAGIVAEVVPLEDYWADPRFGGKKPGRSRGYPDNIYRIVNGSFEQVPNPTHKLENMRTDIGGARSLVFQTIWYLGPAAPMLPAHFGLRMNGGRRTNLSWEINEPTWRELKLWLDDAKAHAGSVGLPIVDPSGPACLPSTILETKTLMQARQIGYYSVTPKHSPFTPIFAHWDGQFWKAEGSGAKLQDHHFANIGDRPVHLTPEQEAKVHGVLP